MPFLQDAAHQIGQPERAIDISDQVGASLCHRAGGRAFFVMRQIHQYARLFFFRYLLNQRDFRRNASFTRIACTFHRAASSRLREHIKTKSPLIA